jgi:hypothetical protein
MAALQLNLSSKQLNFSLQEEPKNKSKKVFHLINIL